MSSYNLSEVSITHQEKLRLLVRVREGLITEFLDEVHEIADREKLTTGGVISRLQDTFCRGVGHYASQSSILGARVAFVRALMSYSALEPGLRRVIITERDRKGDTPLHEACWLGNTKMARLLVGFGARLDIVNKFEETPVHRAVRSQKLDTILYVIHLPGAPLNAKNKNRETALHLAAELGDYYALDAMLALGQHIDNCRDRFGRTAKDVAEAHQWWETAVVLGHYGY
ncbi:ankyrin repeat-containing domain protein [Hypoxylon crocopeplum]|nr:ankyrin repeat-containing domain protein [Hypoxylon crocopeplum]